MAVAKAMKIHGKSTGFMICGSKLVGGQAELTGNTTHVCCNVPATCFKPSCLQRCSSSLEPNPAQAAKVLQQLTNGGMQ